MLLRAHEHKQMVWKNGGGTTSEIAREPNNEQEEFDWRLSIAQVKSPGGPFSCFTGIDRTLCVISPHGLRLTFTDGCNDTIYLNSDSLPYSFPGEVPIVCQIHDEVLFDLNVMTRRTKFKHHVERINMMAKDEKQIPDRNNCDEIIFIVVGQGRVITEDGIQMTNHDALRIDQNSSNQKITAETDKTQIYIIRINPISIQSPTSK